MRKAVRKQAVREQVVESHVELASVSPVSSPPSAPSTAYPPSTACPIFGQRFYSYGIRPAHGVGSVGRKPVTARCALACIKGNFRVALEDGYVVRATTPDDNQSVCFSSPRSDPIRALSREDALNREAGYYVPGALRPHVLTPAEVAQLWDAAVGLPVATMGFLGRGEIGFITARLPQRPVCASEAWRRPRPPRPHYLGLLVSYADWTMARFFSRGIRVEDAWTLRRALNNHPLVSFDSWFLRAPDRPWPFELGPTATPILQHAEVVMEWLADAYRSAIQPREEPLNVALLKRVQREILSTPQQFTKADWHYGDVQPGAEDKSSAVACLGGWAVVLADRVRLSTMQPNAIELRARQLLGLSDDEEADRLFCVGLWPCRLARRYRPEPVMAADFRANARTAATRLGWFIASDGEW